MFSLFTKKIFYVYVGIHSAIEKASAFNSTQPMGVRRAAIINISSNMGSIQMAGKSYVKSCIKYGHQSNKLWIEIR